MLASHSAPCAKICCASASLTTAWLRFSSIAYCDVGTRLAPYGPSGSHRPVVTVPSPWRRSGHHQQSGGFPVPIGFKAVGSVPSNKFTVESEFAVATRSPIEVKSLAGEPSETEPMRTNLPASDTAQVDSVGGGAFEAP